MSTADEQTTKPRLRIPWWTQRSVGAGDVVAAATKAVGIKPCGGCQRRREALNRLVAFGGTKKQPSNGS